MSGWRKSCGVFVVRQRHGKAASTGALSQSNCTGIVMPEENSLPPFPHTEMWMLRYSLKGSSCVLIENCSVNYYTSSPKTIQNNLQLVKSSFLFLGFYFLYPVCKPVLQNSPMTNELISVTLSVFPIPECSR